MKNSKKIMLGSALILALSVSTITNISYADQAIDVEKKSEQVTKENQLDKNKLIDKKEKKDDDSIKEIPEENKINDEILSDEGNDSSDEADDQILSDEENDSSDEADLETDDNADLKENSNLEKMSEKSDESNKQYSRIDENLYKHRDNEDNITFNKEGYDKDKEYEKSDEYQRSQPYSKVQNIKNIEENKRIEKFDENLDIGFADGTIAKNSASVLEDFVKLNYKNDKAYFADSNLRRFNISFDTKDFDPSKVGEYKIKASVLSYTYRHSGFDIRLGHLVENFIRVKVVDDGNDRVFYDTFDKAFKAAEDALKKENRLNKFTVRKSPENSKYFYTLSYNSAKDNPEYTPDKNSKEEIDRWYKDYNETREFLENAEKNGFQDLSKYDKNSQAMIRHFIDSKFSSKYSFLTREEFEKAIPYQLLESNINFYKNFYYSIANKVKLLAQYDFKNKSVNKQVKLNDRNFITICNADLEKGNKLPSIKDLVDFKDLKDNIRVDYNWDPDTIDTNKLGKQTLKVKFTYFEPDKGEKELTENIIINIVDSKNSPSEKLSKKDNKGKNTEVENKDNKDNISDNKEEKDKKEDKKEDKKNDDNKTENKNSNKNTEQEKDGKNKDSSANKGNGMGAGPLEKDPEFKAYATKDEAIEKAKEALKNNNKYNHYEIKTTDDGKYYYELSKKDDQPVKTIKVQTTNSDPKRVAKSNNVETGVSNLTSIVAIASTSLAALILSKKNK
ncbi:MAG: DUF5633 domain-containing protein [Anaerococcus vaginalis]|nr:DUF5633 domain-containing protein [Anaerococcus vaginalis]